MKTRLLLSVSLFSLCTITFFFSGCNRKNNTEKAREEGILLLGNGPEPSALDPQITSGTSDLNIQLALFEGLVSPDPSGLEPLPGVAESWDVSENGLLWTFRLREAARWSDGEPVRAGDFVAAYRRVLTPELAAPNAPMFNIIAGAREFNQGETKDAQTIGVRAVDELHLEITLAYPVPYLLSVLLHPVFGPIPAHLMKKETFSQAEREGNWATAENFVGNGPFVLKAWRPNQYVEVEKSPNYWDAETVRLNGIRFFVYDEAGAEERAFLGHQLHITDSLPPARVAAYRQTGDERLRIDPYLGTYYILLNHRIEALAVKKVRLALAMAIDKKIIVENLLGAGQTVANGFVPESMPNYDSISGFPYNPAAARKLLAEAGYPGGKGFPELTYLFNSSESHRRIGEALRGMWETELGIHVMLENVEWRTYLQRREAGDFEMARAVWIGDYADPSSFLNLWSAGSGNNWSGWQNRNYESKLSEAKKASANVDRWKNYRKAEELLIEDQPFIPLYHYVTVYLKAPYVKGWKSNLLDWHPYKQLYFEPESE